MSYSRKPRILFAANLHPAYNFMMQRYESIIRALEDYQVEFIDIFDFFNDYEQALKLESLCFSGEDLHSYFDNIDVINLNRHFLNHIRSYEWDILCLCTISHYSFFLLPSTLRELSAGDKLVIGFLGDDETMFSKHQFWVGLFDAVVTYTEYEAQKYQQINEYTYLLPIGVGLSPAWDHKPAKEIDVIFVGRPYGNRVDIIRAIKESGISIQVFGSRDWLNYSDLEDVYQGFLEQKAFWSKLAQSKIVLNLMEDAVGEKPHINAKVFEAAMAGSLAVTTYYPPFESTYGLEDGKNIIFYQSVDDLIKQLDYYLAHDEHRSRVASQLRQHLFAHFAYQDLYRRLFNRLEKQWWEGASESALRQPVNVNDFSVIQFISNESDYQQAREIWSVYPEAHIIYVSKGVFACPGTYSILEFLRQLDAGLAEDLKEYIVLTSPQTTYDPVMFNLVRLYGMTGAFGDGVYCNSVVHKKRLCKSVHLFDLGNSIWRCNAFLKYAHSILLWYQLIGPTVPRCLVQWDLTLLQVFLTTTLYDPSMFFFIRYRYIIGIARKLKDWLTG